MFHPSLFDEKNQFLEIIVNILSKLEMSKL